VHTLARKEAQEDKISLLSPFRHRDFMLLLVAASFKVAASRVNYDLTGLVYEFSSASDPASLVNDVILKQNEFFVGVCVGTLVSATFFMLVFNKKIYLLIVFFNSIQIVFEVILISLIFIQDQIKIVNTSFEPHDKIPEPLFIIGGLLDVSSMFLLINVLPALLALKYKGSKFEITMAGTLISMAFAGAYVMGTIIEISVSPFYWTTDTTDKNVQQTSYKRIVFCFLLIFSSMPYLEWAHLEWQDIWKMRSKSVEEDIRKGK
jgi:hypothetical protein